MKKLEAVQRRMACFVYNEYEFISVTNLLKNLSWPTLQQRRTCNRGIMLYKILNKQVEIPIIPIIFDQTLQQQGVITEDLSSYNVI